MMGLRQLKEREEANRATIQMKVNMAKKQTGKRKVTGKGNGRAYKM